jgi:alkanesulfonate monooxygenase SsuD/methylene tetrahydromethanopterin reductase-like flavin-dependent oxidoreductase (luciferase family)
MDSVYSYGVAPVEVRDRFNEARELILRAWEATEPFAFNGKYTKLRYVNPVPRPVQQPPPIWVPGVSSRETWDLVIDHDYCYGHLSFSGLAPAKPVVDAFWDHVQERGGVVNPHRMAFAQICCVADSDAEAEREYADAVRYFYSRNKISPRFAGAPGYRGMATVRAEVAERGRERSPAPAGLSLEDRRRAAYGEMSFWEYDEKGFIIAGGPERVAQRVRELAETLRVGQFIATLQVGNLGEEQTLKNTHLFGTQVIPRAREVFADRPDYWTPVVSQKLVGANQLRLAPVAGG